MKADPMFRLFKTVIIQDPQIGELKRRGRSWDGTISLAGSEPVKLEIDGTRDAPFPQVLETAYQLPSRYETLKPIIAKGLFEHLEPYLEALSDPKERESMLNIYDDPRTMERIERIASPQQAFAESQLIGVEIGMEKRIVRLLIKFRTLWDEEHKVGAYFDDWVFQELNGSVV